MACWLLSRLWCDSTTPLGELVEPEVYWISASESGPGAGTSPAAPRSTGRESVPTQRSASRPASLCENHHAFSTLAAVVKATAGWASCTSLVRRTAERL